jgi:hypothetical protein
MAMARADPGTALFDEAQMNGHLVSDTVMSNPSGVHSDMFTHHLIKNKEFDPESLSEINEVFHRTAIRISSFLTLKYLLSHPSIALSTMFYFIKSFRKSETIRDNIIKLFFCRLFYLNALSRITEFERK